MNLFRKIKMEQQRVRFGNQPLEKSMIDSVVHYVSQIKVPEKDIPVMVRFHEGLKEVAHGKRKGETVYYLQFFSDHSREGCLNSGYAAGQAAAYLRFRGIAAVVLSAVPEWLDHDMDNFQCTAVLAFGCKENAGRKIKNSSLTEVPCIRLEKGECWSEEILELMKQRGITGSEFTHLAVRGSRMHFLFKAAARKHPQRAAVDAGILIANIMAAAEELWIDLEIIKQKEISETGYLLSLCPKEELSICYA